MEDLNRYARMFDEFYPKYDDARYKEIRALIKVYDATNSLDFVLGESFAKAAELLKPLIRIKNYKSQTPFPEDFPSVVACIIKIRATKVTKENVLEKHNEVFESLCSMQGFQLPTVSAVFHFCHPRYFPIVDKNVAAACALLRKRFAKDFRKFDAPVLPMGNASPQDNKGSYAGFMKFINRIVELQAAYGGDPDYRFVDKALMVLGHTRFRDWVENPEDV